MKEKTSILIVDDDHGMSETLADIFIELDYDVSVADNGYRAIEMIKKKAYDIAFMDVKMPGINGIETFMEVKNISPSTKIIMITAYSVETLVKTALEEGAYGIIYKPMNIDKILDLIKKAEKGVLVLVVDDDPGTCETLKDVLIEKNYEVGTANNGEEAIIMAGENDYDIVFIDMKMPVMNGLETFLSIKKVNPKVTAVMITGYGHDGDVSELVEESLRNSAYVCLFKPLDMDKVTALVEEISRQKRKGELRKSGRGSE